MEFLLINNILNFLELVKPVNPCVFIVFSMFFGGKGTQVTIES